MTEPDRALLTRCLAAQRDHVLTQLEGLTDDQLRAPVLPSGWTPLGLVRHLTLSDERYWFEVVVAGGSLGYWPDGENADWQVADDEAATDVLTAYRAAISTSERIVAGTALDAPPARPEAWWPEAGMSFPDLRTVILHVLVETATHAGHLDAVRELLDGRQHIVL